MNRRTVHIVRKLSSSATQQTLGGLADSFQVSERTIRNDIKSLNVFLESESLGQIYFGSGGTVLLPDNFSEVESRLPVEDTFVYKLSSAERKELAAAILVGAADYMTLNSIGGLLSVSRATILNDFDGIKQVVRENCLQIVSKPSHGIRVEGPESLKRSFLVNFLLRDAPIVSQWQSLPANVAMREDLIIIKKILNEHYHARGISMPDRQFQMITNYLCVCVLRSRLGCYLDPQEFAGEKDELSFLADHALERDVIDLVSQYCAVALPKAELEGYITICRTFGAAGGVQFDVDEMQVKKISRLFIRHVSRDIGVDLNGDYDLFEYLSNHLQSMFTTDPSHFPENPVLNEVVNDQPEVLAAVVANLDPIQEFAGREISRVEIIYIALHICAALERRKNRSVRPRVVVVCDGGVGTSQLLAEELRGRFDIKIVKVMPAHDVAFIDIYHADLVISTVPLVDCPVEHVVVRLPLKEAELRLVREKLKLIEPSVRQLSTDDQELSAQGLLDKIEPIITDAMGPDSALLKEIRIEVRRYFRETQHIEDQLIAPYLHQLLPASHIKLDVECSDWRDAIRKSASILLDMGYIENRYIDSMIEGVSKYGPYIVLAPGFAVPHSSPESGAVKMGMSLIRLKDPVCFGSEENDPISFVCTLSAVDRKMHLKAFADLLDMITMPSNKFLDALHDAKDSAEAASLIERYEYIVLR